MRRLSPPIEPLEARIAPAVYFLNGTGATPDVVDKTGASVNNAAAKALASSDVAVALAKGDSLVLDLDGDHTFSAGDTLLVSVRAGSAFVFATDTSPDGHFDTNEITGLAVGDAFQGTVTVGVNGSIVTALNADGTLAVTGNLISIQHSADISALTVLGTVTGNIFAGGSIHRVKITGGVLGNIATGTAVSVNAQDPHLKAADTTFDAGTILTPVAFMAGIGAVGGNITDIRIDQGVHNIIAGTGGNNDAGLPGHGGDVSRVAITMTAADPVWIYAGDGGISNTSTGARGGHLGGITIKYSPLIDATNGLSLRAGNGGRGSELGNGGAGGSISDTAVIVNGAIPNHAISLTAGNGGQANGNSAGTAGGSGGAGGSIVDTVIEALGSGRVVKKIAIAAGLGGKSVAGVGGNGGGVFDAMLITETTIGDGTAGSGFEIAGGVGGIGKMRGGVGGALSGDDVYIRANINAPQVASIHAGLGGALLGSATTKSIAGRGGAIVDLTLGHFSDITAGLTIASGDGGSAGAATNGSGGAGGALNAAITGSSAPTTDLILKAGDGGVAGTSTGAGGNGGRVYSTNVTESGTLKSLTIKGGIGAEGKGGRIGGNGGLLDSLRIITGDVTAAVAISAGAGGKSSGGAGSLGGVISNLNLQTTGNVGGVIRVEAGAGAATGGGGAGGRGGNITGSVVTNIGTATSLSILTGVGGDAGSDGAGGIGGAFAHSVINNIGTLSDGTIMTGKGGGGGAGAHGGTITDVTVRAMDSKLAFIAGAGGAASTSSRAGAGGSIDGISGAVDLIDFSAGNGGSNTGGPGGNGGGVRNVAVGVVSRLVHSIVAGNGGDGATSAGTGGSVSAISVAGDIGDFTKNFDVVNSSGMGGIVAGQAGSVAGNVIETKNGSITGIVADRIATMIAGRPAPNQLTNENAVLRISKLTTNVIGADVNGDGSVAHTNTDSDPAYNLNQPGDTLLDGIVLVRSGGLAALPPGVIQFNVRFV